MSDFDLIFERISWPPESKVSLYYPSDLNFGEESSAQQVKQTYKSLAVLPEQTHSLKVGIVEEKAQLFPGTDALVSFRRDCPVGIITADCVPIVLYAPDVEGIAAVHAGWRGTLGGIIEKALDVLIRRGASPSNIMGYIAPSIRKEHYEVDDSLANEFVKEGFGDFVSYPDGNQGKPHIDLAGVNLFRMLRMGVKASNVRIHSASTFNGKNAEGVKYPSYRRSGGSPVRMLTMIELPAHEPDDVK